MKLKSWTLSCLTALMFAGCAVPQPQNTPVQQEFEINPVTGKGYFIYVPSSYRHDRPMPLIITCHGTWPYDIADMHIREWKMLGEQKGCIIVAPELVATDGIFGDGPLPGMQADERYILTIIGALGYRYNIDRNNIMITGFSGGGFPTYWIGLRNPDVFSVVVARNCNFSENNLDGWYAPEAQQARIMVYYGEADPAAIVLQSRAALDYFQRKGFHVSSTVIPNAGHERHPEVAMQFFLENMRPPRSSLPGSTDKKQLASAGDR